MVFNIIFTTSTKLREVAFEQTHRFCWRFMAGWNVVEIGADLSGKVCCEISMPILGHESGLRAN